jgi:hypothetical protein
VPLAGAGAGLKPDCAGAIFNASNGGLFRWEHMWPRIADPLGMQAGPIRDIKLVEAMADKGELWSRTTARYDLRPIPYDQLVDRSFADFQWRMNYTRRRKD